MITLPNSNFIILLSDDSSLIDYILRSNFGNTYGNYILLEDPVKNRTLFTSKSFLNTDNSKHVYWCKDINILISNEDLWESLLSGKFCNGNILVVSTSKLDARTKFAKKFKKVSVEISPAELDLIAICPELSKLNKSQCESLFINCGNNVTRLLNEFNKIQNFSAARNITIKAAYDELLQSNDLPNTVNDNVFNLIEDLLFKKSSSVYKKLHVLGKTDFDFGLLVNLYSTFRKLYIYEECSAQGRLNNSGLSAFDIKTVSKYHNLFGKQQLLNVLKFLQKLDSNIKEGTMSSDYALDYMVVGVLNS